MGFCESMVVDVYVLLGNCVQCERNRVGKRRKTNKLKTLLPTEPLTVEYMDLLGILPDTEAGNIHLLVIVDRFSKLTRALLLLRADVKSISAALLDHWVAAYVPPTTVLTGNGQQLSSKSCQGVCSLSGSRTDTPRRTTSRRTA